MYWSESKSVLKCIKKCIEMYYNVLKSILKCIKTCIKVYYTVLKSVLKIDWHESLQNAKMDDLFIFSIDYWYYRDVLYNLNHLTLKFRSKLNRILPERFFLYLNLKLSWVQKYWIGYWIDRKKNDKIPCIRSFITWIKLCSIGRLATLNNHFSFHNCD